MSDALTITFDELAGRLRAWTVGHDAHVRAAVDLLIWHETWLRRLDFVAAAVRIGEVDAWISFTAAREAFDAGTFAQASSTELGVLDLAIALGVDRYRLSRMGDNLSRAVADAVATAVGQR